MRSFPLLILMAACSKGEITVDPLEIEWGEIDFMQEMPEGGYEQQNVTVKNSGEKDLEITIPSYDKSHICIQGFDDHEGAIIINLEPDQSYLLVIGVCGYDIAGGERDTLISGTILFKSDKKVEDSKLNYSFIPVREFGEETG